MFNVDLLLEEVHIGEYDTIQEAVDEAKSQSEERGPAFVCNGDYSHVFGAAFSGVFVSELGTK